MDIGLAVFSALSAIIIIGLFASLAWIVLILIGEGVTAFLAWLFDRPKKKEVKVITIAMYAEGFGVTADFTEEGGLWLNLSDHKTNLYLMLDWDHWYKLKRAARKVEKANVSKHP